MAADKQATAAPAAAPAAKEAAPAPAPAKPLPMPVVVALYVTAVLGAAVLVEKVLVPWANATAAPARVVTEAPAEHPEAPGGEAGEGALAGGNVYVIEDLVVNPAESGGLRYVAASVGLKSANPTFVEDMKNREAPIKDALIRILGSKTVDQLADIKARESMRAEILAEVDRLIPGERVDAVYFTRFVLQ